MYRSAMLFHGPGSRNAALRIPPRGHTIFEFGLEGLKIAESRAIVETMEGGTVGGKVVFVIIGPMDLAQIGASDVLLKVLEEFDPERAQPLLWAKDLMEVRPTIRSRCLHQWCPGKESVDEDVKMKIRDVLAEMKGGHNASVIEMLKDEKPREVLEAVAEILGEEPDDEIWEKVRVALTTKKPSMTEVLSVLLV